MENVWLDIPRLYTAIAEWAACMVYILNMKKRFEGKILAFIALGGLLIQSFFLVATGNVNIILWIPCMAAAVMMMIGFICLCHKGNWKDAVYVGLHAFVLAEFAASFEWLMHCYFFKEKAADVSSFWMVIIIYGIIYGFYGKLLTYQQLKNEQFDIIGPELMATLLIAVSIFAVSNLGFVSMDTPFSTPYQWAIAIIRSMVDLGGAAIMYAYYLQRFQIRMKRELSLMQNIVQNQYLQYQMSKESIDLINYKYHDLKHQIAVLRAEENAEKRMAFLDRMEEEIHRYEVQNKTGNKVLDAVLTSKNVVCEQNGISLNCVADGELLDFMDVMDLCTILGNALDNAIECEMRIQEKEKRLIHMAVFSKKDFLIMRFENYFDGELKISEGILKTTKTKRSELHGYGIMSIKHAVKKYDGAVNINVQENWFELQVLIPIPLKD